MSSSRLAPVRTTLPETKIRSTILGYGRKGGFGIDILKSLEFLFIFKAEALPVLPLPMAHQKLA